MNKKHKGIGLSICSLFCGCGGLDLGLIGGFSHLGVKYPKTGLTIAWAADNDIDAIKTYRANARRYLGTHEIFEQDIRTFQDFKSLPPFQILAAGFPCQPFSNAGKRLGINDDDGRGTLFEECARFMSQRKISDRPLAYVFENVKGILSSRMPDGTTVPDEISKRMRELGYNCSGPYLVKSEDFGVPQRRHRVIIIGLRRDLGVSFDYNRLGRNVRTKSLEQRTVRDAIADVRGLQNSDDIWALSPQAKRLVPMITRSWKDIPYEDLPERLQRVRDNIDRYRAPNFYRRFALDEINGTITSMAQPENCGIIHPKEDRRYSVREIARIQSFPDGFKFVARDIPGMYKMIGNAVPPVLGWAIGMALRDVLCEATHG